MLTFYSEFQRLNLADRIAKETTTTTVYTPGFMEGVEGASFEILAQIATSQGSLSDQEP